MTNILVVDDDPTTRFMMSEFLDMLGYNHVVVESGAACLAKLSERPTGFDLVLMDIHMPGRTGVCTTASIRDLEGDPPRAIPIVAMTADTDYHAESRVQAVGMNAVLPKPVRIDQLDTMLEALSA